MNAEAKAKEFLHRYQITSVTPKELERSLNEQGFTVVRFNHIRNSEDVAQLLEALGLGDMAQRSNGFAYADADFRLVFLREGLTEQETLKVLAHEEGHICCGHMGRASVLGQSVEDEFEANAFVQCLLDDRRGTRLKHWAAGHRGLAVLIAVLVLALTSLAIGFTYEKLYWSDCYVTETGEKYHQRDCVYVKNKENVRRLPRAEVRDGGYEPCRLCLPEP